MAEKEEKSSKIESKIPVFTVSRNGCVLKNIFLSGPGGKIREEYENMPILIGRHPDCHVTLDHPSISRFHLEILAKPSVQKISVVDRSSVHGTWVSGTKIEPNIPFDLKEGDILRLGVSTREYRLQWLSLNKAYEMEDPLPPLIEEKEDTHQEEICQEVLTDQDELPTSEVRDELISSKLEKAHQSPVREDLEEDSDLISGSVPPALECTSIPLESSESVRSTKRGTPSNLLSRRSKSKSINSLSIQTGITKEMNRDLFEKSGAKEAERENEVSELDKENMTPIKRTKTGRRTAFKSVKKKSGKSVCILGEAKQSCGSTSNENSSSTKKKSREIVHVLGEKERDGESAPEVLFENCVENESFASDKKKSGKSVCILGEAKQSGGSTSNAVHENENSSSTKENITMQVSISKSSKKSREIVPAVLFENCIENESFASDKENMSPNFSSTRYKNRPDPRSSGRAASFRNEDFGGVKEENCEYFSSDKENCTPDSKLARKSRQPICDDNAIIEIGERKETERVPFGVLFDNVSVPSRSPLKPHCTIPDNNSVCGTQRKEWVMVVDLGCLLGEESIKAIRLLQGLKGTRLIIPRIVIRELDCMKRREGLFRRPNKQASAILKWIEECMEREPMWIHVQSSSETLHVAPTPPVTPTSLFLDVGADPEPGFGFNLNAIFSPRQSSFVEVATPTSEDHVLECAILFKKLRGGGDAQVALLSSSTTLKIKAMAEGLLCEEAKEFKESLTSPCSKRFMWASSSPRRPTWSCAGDVAANGDNYNSKKNNNNPVIARRAFKAAEAIKGLKLIMHCNSHYGQTSLVN